MEFRLIPIGGAYGIHERAYAIRPYKYTGFLVGAYCIRPLYPSMEFRLIPIGGAYGIHERIYAIRPYKYSGEQTLNVEAIRESPLHLGIDVTDCVNPVCKLINVRFCR